MRFKKRSHFHGFMVSHGKAGKAGYVDVEAITSLPEDLAEIIYKGNYTKQQIFFFMEMKLLCIGRRCHLGLSEILPFSYHLCLFFILVFQFEK